MNHALPLGAVVGIVGGGQLGAMLAQAARALGYRVAVLAPESQAPAVRQADIHVAGRVDDPEALRRLAATSAVVTFETEDTSAAALETLAVPVRPSPGWLGQVQDRLAQRALLARQGLPQTVHVPVHDRDTLAAAARFPFPGILKRRRGGYDGRGQCRIDRPSALGAAWTTLDECPCVLEALVPFTRELSIAAARDLQGNVACFPLAENVHRNGILHTTRVPASASAELQARAAKLATDVAVALEHVGVLTIELFEVPGGRLLVNEIALRVHNSAHFTWGACATSQFEQHIRAICGLPLGSAELQSPAAMLNLLGDLWRDRAPDFSALSTDPNARVVLYGKTPRPGRKMGHVVVLDTVAQLALDRALKVHEQLGGV